jgi:hypothetical protein
MIACLDAESRNVTLVISQALARGAYIQAWRLPFLLFGFFDSGRHADEAVAAADLARRYAAEAIDLARSSANPEALARASVHLAGCLRSGDPPAAQSLLDQAASIARRLGTTDLEIAIWCVRALLAMDAGATDSAFTLLDQAAELSRATRNIRKEAGVLGCLGLAHLRAGDESAAARCLALASRVCGLPDAVTAGAQLSLTLADLARRGYTDA